jgi:lactoylglutathione lyase
VTDKDTPCISLRLLVLKTRQVDKVREFYQILGVPFTEERHGDGPGHYAGQASGTTIEVYPLPDDATAADTSVRLGFDVTDLDRVLKQLRGLGTPIVTDPRMTAWGYRAVVRDPDGRAVELYGKGNHP